MMNERDLHILYMRETGHWPNSGDIPLGLRGISIKRDNTPLSYLQWLEKKLLTTYKIFTCFECKVRETCEYAFDNYNTGGDCLANK
jgi:hypothetical protein